MRIGLFGGTFNPIHNGHIQICLHVLKEFCLDKIFFIPSASPPHKPDANLASAADRFDMVKKSLTHYPHFRTSDRELHRKGPSYTIDTIHSFKQAYHAKTQFFLLMGSDAFLDITTWKKPDEFFNTIKIIIMLRGDWKDTREIGSFIDENISKGYCFNMRDNTFSHKTKQKIFICRVPKIDISSTKIRERIHQNLPIHNLVPGCVDQMIKQKELYT
jgi:nicotinate-nucleotide adenylyltransferase